MSSLSLRFRVFLFFCLMAFGGIVAVLVGSWLGYRQLEQPGAGPAFVTVVIVSAFGLLGLSTFVWRLFDENVSKPIEALAAQFRVRSEGTGSPEMEADLGQYLGDLAPAASVLQRKLGEVSSATADAVAERTERLERQRAHLLQILSDIPSATIFVTKDHQVALYDGQAADLMEREAPARLFSSVFEYLDEGEIRRVLDAMSTEGAVRREITIKGNSGDIYSGHVRRFEDTGGYTLMLEPLAPDASRPLVYDFDLLDKPLPELHNAAALRDLTFVVFDSETTGLDPEKDEVVQLGAVRVVNGKIVAAETFDTLVNPGMPIPKASTRVHRISDEMVAGAPDFAEVRENFHAFCQGAVLVAHNAPFDMAFLRRHAPGAALTFDNPVLDTVHLSAIVFGGSARHTLDALCDRLGIEIPDELRHTALGDAMATAEALVAAIPILEGRGLCTLGEVRAEASKHSRILAVE